MTAMIAAMIAALLNWKPLMICSCLWQLQTNRETPSVIQKLVSQAHRLTCDIRTFLIQTLVSQACRLTCDTETFI